MSAKHTQDEYRVEPCGRDGWAVIGEYGDLLIQEQPRELCEAVAEELNSIRRQAREDASFVVSEETKSIRADAAAQLARLREALQKYGRHDDKCGWYGEIVMGFTIGGGYRPCTCGLAAILAGAEGRWEHGQHGLQRNSGPRAKANEKP